MFKKSFFAASLLCLCFAVSAQNAANSSTKPAIYIGKKCPPPCNYEKVDRQDVGNVHNAEDRLFPVDLKANGNVSTEGIRVVKMARRAFIINYTEKLVYVYVAGILQDRYTIADGKWGGIKEGATAYKETLLLTDGSDLNVFFSVATNKTVGYSGLLNGNEVYEGVHSEYQEK